MGRVFTINFNFEQKVSKALVCRYERGYTTFFKVHVFNEDLHTIIPSGNLEFSFSDGLKAPAQLTHQKGAQLVECITGEISHFLHAEEQSR